MVDARDRQDMFFRLTPEKVLEAVEAGGLETTGVCYPLNSFENRVYEIELVDKSRVVAKFYRPGRWRREQILEEHRFLAELAAEEVPVVPPRPFPDDDTLKTIEGIYYAISDRRGGRAPDELDDALAHRLGMLVARIHNVAARRDVDDIDRPRLDAERYVHQPLAFLRENDVLPSHLEPRYRAAAEAIAAIADERMAGVEPLLVHGDLHLGNVLLRDGVLALLDFDDMAIGPPVQDLWLALPGRDPESLHLRQAMLAGYEQFRLFDPSTLDLIEPLRGLRLVRYAGWLARRWDDPAFKTGWPHFGSEDYWHQETEDLEELLRLIEKERPVAAGADGAPRVTAEEEKELTNKDYFWDWEED